MERYLGIDIGSTASKCVIADEDGRILAAAIRHSGAGTAGPQGALDEALMAAGLAPVADLAGLKAGELEGIAASCSTGYGRHLYDWTDYQMSELSCHARGAHALCPQVKTVIDIGGQDAKVLSVEADGTLKQFAMNDKCAAGTGRFLDVMAGIFGVSVDDLSDLDARSTETVGISSTCTVFAESEVISKLAGGTPIENVAAGVNASVVERTAGLVRRLGAVPTVFMTGGVSQNARLRERLGENLGVEILTSPDAQYAGALGAALTAKMKSLR